MSNRKASEVLDPLGVVLDLEDDQRVTECLVLAKVIGLGEDGQTSLTISASDGLDWIARAGLLAAAAQVEAMTPPMLADEDD